MTDYLFRPAETLRALPPNDADVRALIDRLKVQPMPSLPSPVTARLPWKR